MIKLENIFLSLEHAVLLNPEITKKLQIIRVKFIIKY